MTRLPAALALALALLAPLQPLAAQIEVPSLRWQTIRTEHFRIHYEPQLEAWARNVAAQMESVRSAVATRVGYTPPQIIDIVIEDPYNTPNGSAWPFLSSPAMRFWATPPAPTSVIGSGRGWGELLAVHEYAHLAHLLRPSRQPFTKFITFVSGVPVGPVTRSPAWVAEGYATVIEGELTGTGRPNGVARPAILRQLAIEGYLPSYAELNGTSRFQGGAMRYLVGSAYLEWLQAQRGDSVLPQLWRRMTARVERNFNAAFTGSFGDAPDVLYGRFSAELTANAIAAKAKLEAQGLARGELVQHWEWSVGAPALSPNGELLAITRSSPSAGTRTVILTFKPESLTAEKIAEDSTKRAKRRAKDPEDVEDYSPYPKALRRVKTLVPRGGEAFFSPRWMRDGDRLLVSRFVPLPDGRTRPDLFVWDYKRNKTRRVTRGAGIVLADEIPGGSRAAALTCGSGTCSIVTVDLTTGTVSPLADGGIDRSFAGVRVSPDGTRLATAQQRGARWELVVVRLSDGAATIVGPGDGATRYSPTWENDSTLIAVSEASGVATIERVRLSGEAPLTVVRTTGSAQHPEVGPDGRVWWLDLHARGWDLRVNAAGSGLPAGTTLATSLAPAVQRRETRLAQEFPTADVPAPRRYGAGPFHGTLLFASTTAPDGNTWSAGANAGDILGRYALFFLAGPANNGGWYGGRAAATYRGFRPELQLQLYSAGHDPSQQRRNGGAGLASFDLRLHGGLAAVTYARAGELGTTTLRAGLSSGTVAPLGAADVDRSMGFGALTARRLFTSSPTQATIFDATLHYASGTTDGLDWTRISGEAALSFTSAAGGGMAIRARGGETSATAPALERFAIGGTASPYVDPGVLSQRIEHLALPFAARGGRRFGILSAETTGPFRIYHDWIAAGDNLRTVDRVLGMEAKLQVPRLGPMRLPAGGAQMGVAHGLQGAIRNATVGYVALTFTP